MAALAVLLALAAALLSPPTSDAAAPQGAATRTLFLTESFRPDSVRAPLAGSVLPEHMVSQAGEEEGFQLALRAPTTQRVEAYVTGHPSLVQFTQVLRVEYVNIRRPSSAMGSRTGRFSDPLPPQLGALGEFGPGKLVATGGEWAGFALVTSMPSASQAGTYTGQVHVRSQTGAELAVQDFSVTVVATRTAQGAADPAIAPHDPRNFKVLFNFNPSWYRALAPATTAQKQYEQTYSTLWMLARHRAAPTHWHRAYPSADGTYSCSAANGYLKVYDDLPWWADGKPGAVPVALMPNHAVKRCSEGFEIRDVKSGRTKFDDTISDVPRSAWFIYRVAEYWRTSGVQDHRTYFLNPFDEPDGAQNRTVVPQVNKLVHDYAPGVKVLASTWPMVGGAKQQCRAGRCATRPGQASDNTNLRDGGADDLDGWIAPYFRSWGFRTSAAQRAAGISRSREVITRLQAIQAAGGEMWTYDLPLGTRQVPQMAIDGPATDARFMFWPLGREGFNGWFTAVSNRWVDASDTSKVRNPWDDPLSWIGTKSGDRDNAGPHGVVSNGWGSLFYPGYRPVLGLTDPVAQPVSSLRLQRLRDGVEDANLMRQYRERFGKAALATRMAGVVGPVRDVRTSPGGEVFPSYRLDGLALRMEVVRRQLLAELAG